MIKTFIKDNWISLTILIAAVVTILILKHKKAALEDSDEIKDREKVASYNMIIWILYIVCGFAVLSLLVGIYNVYSPIEDDEFEDVGDVMMPKQMAIAIVVLFIIAGIAIGVSRIKNKNTQLLVTIVLLVVGTILFLAEMYREAMEDARERILHAEAEHDREMMQLQYQEA